MEIFNAATKSARDNRTLRKDVDDKLAESMKSLETFASALVIDIVNVARQTFIKDGKMRAVLDIDFKGANELVRHEPAEQLIKLKLEQLDPSLNATVHIGPDMSGNWKTKPELVVEFTPKPKAE